MRIDWNTAEKMILERLMEIDGPGDECDALLDSKLRYAKLREAARKNIESLCEHLKHMEDSEALKIFNTLCKDDDIIIACPECGGQVVFQWSVSRDLPRCFTCLECSESFDF